MRYLLTSSPKGGVARNVQVDWETNTRGSTLMSNSHTWKSFTAQMTPQDIEFWSNALLVAIGIYVVIILFIVGLMVYGLFFFRPDKHKPLDRTFPRAPTKVK